MKRIQVRPGKFVTVSTELAEKAARIIAECGFTQEDAARLAAIEAQYPTTDVLLGWFTAKGARDPAAAGFRAGVIKSPTKPK